MSDAFAHVLDLIGRRRAIGWRILRLHIDQPLGGRAVVRIGWRASDLPLEPDDNISVPRGVHAYSWSAPDDDLIEIEIPWSDETTQTLCRAIGSSGFERQVATDGSHIAWLLNLLQASP